MAERIFDNVKITSSFEMPEARENLVSGETLGKLFGKIAKVINDLDPSAFIKTSKIITGTCSTGAGQTALVATIPDYTLADNDILAITFANDVPAGATLNVNGTGAKAIQVNGAAIGSGIIKAKSIALLLYGTAITLIETSNTASDVSGHTIQSDVPANAKFTDTTYEDMTAATVSTDGTHGLVPAPTKGSQDKFLRGDGTWAFPTVIKATSVSLYKNYGITAYLPVESLVSGTIILLDLSSSTFWDNDSDGNKILTDDDNRVAKISINNNVNAVLIADTRIYCMNGYMSDATDVSGSMLLSELKQFSYATMVLIYTPNNRLVCLNYAPPKMFGASTTRNGRGGTVPMPAAGKQNAFLRGDGNWVVPTDTKYTLPTASSSTLGGVQTTSTVTNVTDWTATPIVDGVPYFYDHTYSIMTAATASANGKYGLVPSPAAGKQNSFLRGDGTWADVTASDCLPLAGGTMTGTIKSDAQYPVIVNNGDSRTYGFPLRVNKSDGTAMCNIATQHTDAFNALLFQIYEPSDTSKYAYFNIYADPSTGYRMATNCTMPKNYTAGTVSYGNKATTVTLNYKPSAVLLYCEAVNTGGWAVMGLNASHLTSTGFTIPAGEADNSSVYCFTLKGGSYSPFLGSTVHYIAFK